MTAQNRWNFRSQGCSANVFRGMFAGKCVGMSFRTFFEDMFSESTLGCLGRVFKDVNRVSLWFVGPRPRGCRRNVFETCLWRSCVGGLIRACFRGLSWEVAFDAPQVAQNKVSLAACKGYGKGTIARKAQESRPKEECPTCDFFVTLRLATWCRISLVCRRRRCVSPQHSREKIRRQLLASNLHSSSGFYQGVGRRSLRVCNLGVW